MSRVTVVMGLIIRLAIATITKQVISTMDLQVACTRLSGMSSSQLARHLGLLRIMYRSVCIQAGALQLYLGSPKLGGSFLGGYKNYGILQVYVGVPLLWETGNYHFTKSQKRQSHTAGATHDLTRKRPLYIHSPAKH